MYYSPLRYPGGKSKLTPFIKSLIEDQRIVKGTYIEPFAGGAGVALDLLINNIVSEIVINDYDKGIYSFWRALLTDSERFMNQIKDIELTIAEWEKQRDICLNKNSKYSFELGFATFFLNRTNRSGIIKGGVIGGKEQSGKWKMDARFNKEDLIKRMRKIIENKDRIHLYNKDVESFIKNYLYKYGENTFVYFDPPYYNKGKQLYLNFFDYTDHERIGNIIKNSVQCKWIITYDSVPEIFEIYKEFPIRTIDLNYSVAVKRKASEFIIFKTKSMIPCSKTLKEKNVKIDLGEVNIVF